jgi:polyphenol oxidase
MAGFVVEESSLGRIVVAPSLPAGFAVFYTTVDFEGRINGEIAPAITGLIRDRFGIDASLTTCCQVHSATVQRAQRESRWRECDSCDALWTEEPHVALGIKVADCLPVAMIDPVHSVVANVHSGWRGTLQNIAAETIDGLQRASEFDPATSLAYLGPSIRACCFEVGEEVVEQFVARFDGFERYVDRSKSKPHVDLVAVTNDVLRSRGFREEKIFDSGLCTRCEGSMFHSYRGREKGGGRNLALVAH